MLIQLPSVNALGLDSRNLYTDTFVHKQTGQTTVKPWGSCLRVQVCLQYPSSTGPSVQEALRPQAS